MNPYLTTYAKAYPPKSTIRPGYRGTTSEYKDPLTEAFKTYLELSCSQTPLELPTENADLYLKEKHEQKYPKLAKIYYPEPINNDVMKKNFIYNGRTVYQVDYGDLAKENAYKEAIRIKNLFRLPNDVFIPLTTQKYCYRNPIMINSRAMDKVKQIRVPNNLDPDEKLRQILKVKTPKTNYGGIIGELGEIILNEQLHGKIEPAKCSCSEHNLKKEE